MVRIHIQTRNIGGDEELAEALRAILEDIDNGEDNGNFFLESGDECEWAVNSRNPAFLSDMAG